MSRFLSIGVDGQTLRRAAAGERQAQRDVYDACAGPVFALVRRLVGAGAAEDVFQDSMAGLFRALPGFRGEAPFGAWVRQVALSHCLMHLRSPWQRARRALVAVLPGEEEVAADRDAAQLPAGEPALAEAVDLSRALSRLPPAARVAVWLYDVEGFTHEEIATLFGRSVSFSKSRLSRAHALLRAELDGYRPGHGKVPPAGIAAGGHLP